MHAPRAPFIDETPALLAGGYTWLPGKFREAGAPFVRTRLMGRHTVALRGPDAVPLFYDEAGIRRRGALPEPVRSTLTGHGSVHTLDDEPRAVRKDMFLSHLHDPAGIAELADRCAAEWDRALFALGPGAESVVFDESAHAITRGVCDWTGLPSGHGSATTSADLVAMVDAFGTVGPRHWKGRSARTRQEYRLARLVEEVRSGAVPVPEGSALDTVCRHREADGSLMSTRVAAVELLNIIRPATAVCWYVSFAAHALTLWPSNRERLADAEDGFARAFAQEVRRFYPIAPFMGGYARTGLDWKGWKIPEGALVLLDIYGQNHNPDSWDAPYTFDPDRFLKGPFEDDILLPQGGGDVKAGHRCPGEDITLALLSRFSARLARFDHSTPPQDMSISLLRIPTRPYSGVLLSAGP